MRKLCTIVILLLLGAVGARAQVLRWGIEGGLDMNRLGLKSEYFSSKDNQMGWFLGVKGRVAIPLGGLGLDAAFLYNNKRASVCSLYDGDTPVAATQLDYDTKRFNMFVLPLNVRYNFGVGTLCSIYVATGPQFNWYVGRADKLGFDSRLSHQYCTWNIGGGFEVFHHLQLGITYCIATESAYTNLRTTAVEALDKAFSGKNNSWQVRVAWWF